MAKLRLGVLISGRGSNLQALIDACADPDYPAAIVLVVSNRADAAGLARAERAGIPTRVIPHRAFPDRARFDAAIDAALRTAGVEVVCLAGFMRLLGPAFVDGWADRILNIHPALLPDFKGLNTHSRVLAAACRVSGCTVHLVTAELDAGPTIVQIEVPVMPNDDAESLAARVLGAEHIAYPLAVRLVAEGRVRREQGRVRIDGTGLALANQPGMRIRLGGDEVIGARV